MMVIAVQASYSSLCGEHEHGYIRYIHKRRGSLNPFSSSGHVQSGMPHHFGDHEWTHLGTGDIHHGYRGMFTHLIRLFAMVLSNPNCTPQVYA